VMLAVWVSGWFSISRVASEVVVRLRLNICGNIWAGQKKPVLRLLWAPLGWAYISFTRPIWSISVKKQMLYFRNFLYSFYNDFAKNIWSASYRCGPRRYVPDVVCHVRGLTPGGSVALS
jgi:hypothetical protein